MDVIRPPLTIIDSSGQVWYLQDGVLKPCEVVIWRRGIVVPLRGLPDPHLLVV